MEYLSPNLLLPAGELGVGTTSMAARSARCCANRGSYPFSRRGSIKSPQRFGDGDDWRVERVPRAIFAVLCYGMCCCCTQDGLCSIVKKCASCHGWRQMEYLQTKNYHVAGCGRDSVKRSMNATKTFDILTMSDVCGLCYCRPFSRWRGCVVCSSLQAVVSRHSHCRLVWYIQCWLAPDEQA